MDMAGAGADLDIIDTPALARMIRAGLDGLFDVVEARVGDKTLVDTLDPACAALEKAAASGLALSEALPLMRDAAKAGWESTKDLAAKFGRSSRLGERSRGVYDAGATSCWFILDALSAGILENQHD
jgi:dihydroxyacetone kinase-like protein